jgi:hypothetical protein
MFRKFFSILAIIIVLSNTLYAINNKYQLAMLKGIPSIAIQIELDNDFKKETDLSESRIENLVASRFRQSGIKITDSTLDIFYIRAQLVRSSSCATYMGAKFYSLSYLARDNNIPVGSSIWDREYLISGADNLSNQAIRNIESFVDEFLNLYLEANPREFTSKK